MYIISASTIEYAECGSLYDYLKRNAIDFKQILMWAKEIALGKLAMLNCFIFERMSTVTVEVGVITKLLHYNDVLINHYLF